MRIILTIASLAALAGCGEGSAFDNGFREAYVRKGVDTCVQAAQRGGAAGTAIDFRQLCTCAIERHIEGRSAIELMTENEQEAGSTAERQMEQCIEEAARRGDISPAAAPGAPTVPAMPPAPPPPPGAGGGKPVN